VNSRRAVHSKDEKKGRKARERWRIRHNNYRGLSSSHAAKATGGCARSFHSQSHRQIVRDNDESQSKSGD